MRSILTKFSGERAVCWALVLACTAVVLWVRALPSSLPAAEELTERMAWRKVRERLAAEQTNRPAGEEGKARVEEAAREWVENNRAEYDAAKASLTVQLKSDMSFEAGDGRRYAYLGDFDSYVWLRNARNYLRQGTTCDAVVDGECRDSYGHAPVGSRMIYNRSLHIAAIVGVHKLATLFNPGYPLSASAFLVQVLVGALGALPAFFLGRHFGGNLGGLFAALLISLQPVFLYRSLGSDNDVWNVVLPLFIGWAALAALKSPKILLAGTYAVLAGAWTGIHASVWRGWVFTYAVVLCAALGYLALVGIRQAMREGVRRLWQAEEVRKIACVVVAYYVAAGLFTLLAGAGDSGFFGPLQSIAADLRSRLDISEKAATRNLWPPVFNTVGELRRPYSEGIVRLMGGALFFFGGWLGLLSLLLPKRGWRWPEFTLAGSTTVLHVLGYYVFAASDLGNAVVLLFALLPGAYLIFRVCSRSSDRNFDPGPALLILVWFIVALSMFYYGTRFSILFVVPFGVAFGAGADRVRQWLAGQMLRMAPRFPSIASAASYAVMLAVLAPPVLAGYATAKNHRPDIHSAWWNSLGKIREESRPDAIVNVWWDYGYWAKYAAERRVSHDGGSLQTHLPHWLAKALVAPTEAESRGILRMLDCGSDATPLPEGAQGAYGKLRATGLDDVAAYAILLKVVKLSRAEAERYLADRGLTPAQQRDILAATHCRPPEAFLVLSRDMMRAEKWIRLGTWDVARAYLAHRTRRLPRDLGEQELRDRFDASPAEARAFYKRLAAMESATEIADYVAPPQRLISREWVSCGSADGGAEMSCRIAVPHEGQTKILYFLYDPALPKEGRLKDDQGEGRPAVTLVAGAERLEESAALSPEFPEVGVLMDPANQRILIGSPLLIRSTIVRLLYLGERYPKYFKPFDRRSTLLGDEVTTWKIEWEGE